jgi:hypothetical protein
MAAWGSPRRAPRSLVEGLHRRRSAQYRQSKFPDATGGALDRVKRAARQAAAEKAETEQNLDPRQVREAVKAAAAHLEVVDYAERAAVVVEEVCAAVPEIAESVTDLPKLLTKVRNDFAHQLPQDDLKDPLEIRWRDATEEPRPGGGPVDRPDGSIDDDSVHPLTDPVDSTTGNVDPVVPLGNAATNPGTDAEGQDARLTGPAGT